MSLTRNHRSTRLVRRIDDFCIRRCAHLYCRFDNKEYIDLRYILAGQSHLSNTDRILAISLLAETEFEITCTELDFLAQAPQREWVSAAELIKCSNVTQEQVLSLAEKGLLITDLKQNPFADLRKRDGQMKVANWHPHAALFHFMSKWKEDDLPFRNISSANDKEHLKNIEPLPLKAKVKTRGMIPHHFHSREDALATIDLPLEKSVDPLFETLVRRRTSRHFDSDKHLPLTEFSKILYYTFGCHGLAPMTDQKDIAERMFAVKRTSPSGGALTPVECYPLVTRVEGMEPGLYHYNMERHALEQLSRMHTGQAELMAEEFTSGQKYYANAHVQFILTARFYRNFWKYGNHKKAYKVLLLDAAHLSQTLYLVCTALNLGAFVTTAIHDTSIEKALALDGQKEGVILISGCGINLPGTEQQSEFQPRVYNPESARFS